MVYMRIDRNKFWGWVVVSLLAGLLVGLGVMFVARGSSAGQVSALEERLAAQSKDASDTIAAMQATLASAEASITDLTAQNSQLASDLATAKAAATKPPTVAANTVTITSRSVSPTSVEASHTLVLTVKVTGHPDKVRMQIVGTGYDQTFYLTKISTSGQSETWRRSIKAPTKKGTYRYYAGGLIGTKRVTASTSARTFVVK
jgi:Tfp pilus assembly protein PilX